MLRNCPETVMW